MKKAQLFPRKICYSFSGRDICYLGLCLRNSTPEQTREICICYDSQAALKALQAVRTTSPLVQQCQKALNDISTRHAVGLYWVPGHAGVQGNETANELTRGGSALGFLGPEPALGSLDETYKKGLVIGWSNSSGQDGEALAVHKDRLEN
jgi:hypothetical protein